MYVCVRERARIDAPVEFPPVEHRPKNQPNKPPNNKQDTTERLLPAYIRLTKDDIYRVRKACAEALVELSKAVRHELRSHILLEVRRFVYTRTNRIRPIPAPATRR